MKEFTINVNVTIGVTSLLGEILTAVVSGEKTAPSIEYDPCPGGSLRIDPLFARTADLAAPTVIAGAAPASIPVPQESRKPEESVTPEPAETPQGSGVSQEKELTLEDVREAIARTRLRIEGEDYKENAASPGRKKWHRALGDWFKAQSALYGAAKPALLDTQASRAAFIEDCDNLEVSGDALIDKRNLPF